MRPTAAERLAMDSVAASESAQWSVRRGAFRLSGPGRSLAVVLRALRHPAPGRDASPPRLRFDRVAARVCSELRAAGPALLPAGGLGFVTIRAPIRVAAKTVATIKASLEVATPRRPRAVVTLGNHVRLGVLSAGRRARAGLVCFIHTHERDAAHLQAMTEQVLTLLREPPRRAGPSCLVLWTPADSAWLGAYRHVFEQLADRVRYDAVYMAFGDGKSGQLTA